MYKPVKKLKPTEHKVLNVDKTPTPSETYNVYIRNQEEMSEGIFCNVLNLALLQYFGILQRAQICWSLVLNWTVLKAKPQYCHMQLH